MADFYGTGIEIWAGFGPDLGQLALLKKNWTIYKQLLRPVFPCFHGQKKNRNIFEVYGGFIGQKVLKL